MSRHYPVPSEKTRYSRRNGGHRAVMEALLGRKLGANEFVHHKNGDKLDNRPENLEVIDPVSHGRLHHLKYPVEKDCPICGKRFIPHKTKRRRALTCGTACGTTLMWRTRRERGTDKWARR
jgi:hypothetical protein